MSNIIEFPNREQVYDQASLWIARLDRELTSAEEKALRLWLAESELHKQVFLEMANLWDKMDSLSRLADLFELPAPPQRNRYQRTYAAIAACFALAAFALIIHFGNFGDAFFANKQLTLVDATYETTVGQYNNVQLPDGSRLVVNTNTRVRVEYTDAARLFFLDRGEINIEVAKNTARPLKVLAHDKIVQAVGTAFNVRIFNDREVELLVTHGKVLVAQKTNSNASIVNSKNIANDGIAVSGGEKIILGSQNARIAKVEAIDIAAELSWREGNLVFRGETLEHALREISRYTSVKFEIHDNIVKEQRIAGLFKAGDVDGLLMALEQNFHIYNQRVGDNRIRLTSEKSLP